MLKINNLKVSVEEKQILSGLDMEIKPGEVVALMGPNGSGKSTLANAIMGHPNFKINGSIKFENKEITGLTPDQRSNLGIYLATQNPVAIPGLSAQSLLWQIYKARNETKSSISEFKEWIVAQAAALGLNSELLTRGVNDGFSGGEKKKLETLQMLVFNPKLIIMDEIDSGLDVDALKVIAKTVAKVANERKIGVLVITHYWRILEYLNPDRVIVLEAGKVVREGDATLAHEIEKTGYGVTL
ncbi:MAG: Fe-S cluster assembly ATPase SufC [Candidatus Shapirobacteria bacterium]